MQVTSHEVMTPNLKYIFLRHTRKTTAREKCGQIHFSVYKYNLHQGVMGSNAEGVATAPRPASKRKGNIWRTGWLWINCIIWCILTGIPGILCILLVPFIGLSAAQKLTWRCSVVFFRIVLWSAGCPYTVSGLEQLDLKRSYFFASNHESVFDVPLLFAALPFWLISVAKKSLSYIPIFGWAVACGGTVFIDRKNTDKAIQSMKDAELSLRKRPRSVLVVSMIFLDSFGNFS